MEVLRNVSVLHRLVRNGVLCKVVSNHTGLDFNKDESSTIVATDLGSDHFRKDRHVSEVSFDDLGLDTSFLSGLGDGFLDFVQEITVRSL